MENASPSGDAAPRYPDHLSARTCHAKSVHRERLAGRSGQSSGNRGLQRAAILRPEGPPMKKPIIGEPIGGEPQDEREHFIKCPTAATTPTWNGNSARVTRTRRN